MSKQPQQLEQAPASLAPVAPRKSMAAKLIIIVVLVMVLAIAAGGWCLWKQWQIQQQQTGAQIKQLQQQLSQSRVLLNQQGQTLQATQRGLQTLIEQNQQAQGNHLLMEVNYLVRLATFHLLFENNVVLARQLLAAADQRLATDQTPTVWPLRQVFAKDIAALDAVPKLDLPGIVAQLAALSQQANELPELPVIVQTTPATPTPAAKIAANSTLDKFKIILSTAKQALAKMVIVSRDNQLVPSLLTTEQRLYMVTNIQSQLTLAEWAVVHRQAAIYQQSLAQVDNWLHRYFVAESPLVQSMVKTIANLKTTVVNPTMPDISRSLDALQKIQK